MKTEKLINKISSDLNEQKNSLKYKNNIVLKQQVFKLVKEIENKFEFTGSFNVYKACFIIKIMKTGYATFP